MRKFSHDVRTSKPPEVVRSEALAALSGPLFEWDYLPLTQSESGLTFGRKYRPWWIWVPMVLTLPIGLLLLLVTNTATITMVLEPDNGGTVVHVTGRGERPVRRAFETMHF